MTSSARLASLRRQAGARSADRPVATGVEPNARTPLRACDPGPRAGVEEIQQRVAALRSLLRRRSFSRGSGSPSNAGAEVSLRDRSLPGVDIGAGVQLIERFYPLPDLPSSIALHGLRSTAQQRLARVQEPEGAGVVDPARLLAIDTETTGLAGGTGTRAFMIGVADISDGRMRVRQLLTTRLAGESSMLQAFCDWLREDHVLVSYNGRSYDRPLLSTRLRLARLGDPLPALIHLDLLHVTRRAYRSAWPNCRLATAERELLGVVRDDDLPGSEAPGAWLTYLRGGSSALLHRVAAHNDQDLRSLMGLVGHFAFAASEPGR